MKFEYLEKIGVKAACELERGGIEHIHELAGVRRGGLAFMSKDGLTQLVAALAVHITTLEAAHHDWMIDSLMLAGLSEKAVELNQSGFLGWLMGAHHMEQL